MIGEEPKRLRWRVQLMQEYRSVRDYQSMYDFGVECLEFTKDIDEKKDNWDYRNLLCRGGGREVLLKRV